MDNRVRIRVTVDDDTHRGLAAVRASMASIGSNATRMGDRVTDAFSNMGYRAKKFGAITAAVFAALPGALGLVAAALPVAFGGAFAAIGAFALRSERDVSAAFSKLKDHATKALKQMALPLKGDLIEGVELLNVWIDKLRPAFSKAFGAAGDLIEPLVNSLGKLASGIMPGIHDTLKGMAPVVDAFGDALGQIGDALGSMFATMTSNKSRVAELWRAFGSGVSDLLDSIGSLTSELIDSGEAASSIRGVFTTVSTAIYAAKSAYEAFNLVVKAGGEQVDESGEKISNFEADANDAKLFMQGFSEMLSGNWSKGWDIWNGKTEEAAAKLAKIKERQKEAEEASRMAAEATAAQSREMRGLTDELQKAIDKTKELNQSNRDAIGAQSAYEQAVDDLTAAINGNGNALHFTNGELDLGTQKARDAYKPLDELASAGWANYDAVIANGGAISQANQKLEDARTKYRNAAMAMGLSRDEADKLTDAVLGIPNQKNVRVTNNFKDARRKVSDIDWALRNLKDQYVNVNVKLKGTPMALASYANYKAYQVRASGGLVGNLSTAATGGIRGNRVLVGEHGPEIVDLAAGSRVRSNEDSRRIMGQGGGGGGAVTIYFEKSGRPAEDALLDILKDRIRVRYGGSVDRALAT